MVGASFGGYSTLLGVTFDPKLFKVGIAAVPPVDFAWTLRRLVHGRYAATFCRYMPCRPLLRMLGVDLDDKAAMARLHAQSPLANADKLHRPVLLFAGGADSRVSIRAILAYAARLKLLGKDFSLFVDEDSGHVSRNPMTTEALMYLSAVMLHHDLGGAAAKPPDTDLQQYLRRTLRSAGSDLRERAGNGTAHLMAGKSIRSSIPSFRITRHRGATPESRRYASRRLRDQGAGWHGPGRVRRRAWVKRPPGRFQNDSTATKPGDGTHGDRSRQARESRAAIDRKQA